jgi:photosystem II stability/assembly factor-like uncharacterized protein/uncharacterized protein YceK
MFKNKILLMFSVLLFIMAGCSSASSHKTNQPGSDTKSQVSNGDTTTNTHPSGTSANSSGSSQLPGTSTKSSDTASPATPPATVPTPQNNMNTVTAVRLADYKTGWVGGNGWIAKTITGGKSWSIVYQGSGTVQQLFALNHSDVWAALKEEGNTSKLLQSTDGGQHWVAAGTIPFNDFFHFISKTTVLSSNYISKDGGKTWNTLPIPGNIVGNVYFHDPKNGWAVTQSNNVFYVKRTTNAGNTWETVLSKSLASSPLNNAIIRSAGANDAWIEFIGDSGMSQTSYSVLHTSDGGKSWETVIANSTAGGGPAPGFNQNFTNGPVNKGTKPGPLYVINPQVAFMGGFCPACDKQNSIGWTKNGGKAWINSSVSVEGNGQAFLAMADANHGWWITTDINQQSSLYTTSDGGIHWNQVHIFH